MRNIMGKWLGHQDKVRKMIYGRRRSFLADMFSQRFRQILLRSSVCASACGALSMCTLPDVRVSPEQSATSKSTVSRGSAARATAGSGGRPSASPEAGSGGRAGAPASASKPAENRAGSEASENKPDAGVAPKAPAAGGGAAPQSESAPDQGAPSPPPSTPAGSSGQGANQQSMRDAGNEPDTEPPATENMPSQMQAGSGAQTEPPATPMDAGTSHSMPSGGAPSQPPEVPVDPPTSEPEPTRPEYATWPMPDAVSGSTRAPSYSTTENTVTDNVTHLVWQRRVPASYPGCSGPSGSTCTWQEAKAYCRSAATAAALGGSGWRLPNRIELASLIDETRVDPAIDTSAFPDTPVFGFWSSSIAADFPNQYAWYVFFGDGTSNNWQFSDAYAVRCVR